MSARDKKDTNGNSCGVITTISVVNGKYKLEIVRALLYQGGPMRFGALRRLVASASQKTLTRNLRDLERDGILKREVFAEVPPRVEYELTQAGRDLMPVFLAMKSWGEARLAEAVAG